MINSYFVLLLYWGILSFILYCRLTAQCAPCLVYTVLQTTNRVGTVIHSVCAVARMLARGRTGLPPARPSPPAWSAMRTSAWRCVLALLTVLLHIAGAPSPPGKGKRELLHVPDVPLGVSEEQLRRRALRFRTGDASDRPSSAGQDAASSDRPSSAGQGAVPRVKIITCGRDGTFPRHAGMTYCASDVPDEARVSAIWSTRGTQRQWGCGNQENIFRVMVKDCRRDVEAVVEQVLRLVTQTQHRKICVYCAHGVHRSVCAARAAGSTLAAKGIADVEIIHSGLQARQKYVSESRHHTVFKVRERGDLEDFHPDWSGGGITRQIQADPASLGAREWDAWGVQETVTPSSAGEPSYLPLSGLDVRPPPYQSEHTTVHKDALLTGADAEQSGGVVYHVDLEEEADTPVTLVARPRADLERVVERLEGQVSDNLPDLSEPPEEAQVAAATPQTDFDDMVSVEVSPEHECDPDWHLADEPEASRRQPSSAGSAAAGASRQEPSSASASRQEPSSAGLAAAAQRRELRFVEPDAVWRPQVDDGAESADIFMAGPRAAASSRLTDAEVRAAEAEIRKGLLEAKQAAEARQPQVPRHKRFQRPMDILPCRWAAKMRMDALHSDVAVHWGDMGRVEEKEVRGVMRNYTLLEEMKQRGLDISMTGLRAAVEAGRLPALLQQLPGDPRNPEKVHTTLDEKIKLLHDFRASARPNTSRLGMETTRRQKSTYYFKL